MAYPGVEGGKHVPAGSPTRERQLPVDDHQLPELGEHECTLTRERSAQQLKHSILQGVGP